MLEYYCVFFYVCCYNWFRRESYKGVLGMSFPIEKVGRNLEGRKVGIRIIVQGKFTGQMPGVVAPDMKGTCCFVFLIVSLIC